MQKKVLTEQALYFGDVSMPKGFEIDRDKLSGDILQSSFTNREFPFSRTWDMLNTYMRDESKHKIQCKEILPKGSIIVFPSFVWHRVKPVTSGTRYSLVVWHLGRPFK